MIKKLSLTTKLLLLLLISSTTGILYAIYHPSTVNITGIDEQSFKDSISFYLDKDKKLVAVSENLLYNENLVKELQSENARLAGLVDKYEKDLKNRGGSVTTIDTKTSVKESVPIDSITTDTNCFEMPTYHYTLDSVKNKWRYGSVIARSDSLFMDITTLNEYDLFIGIHKQGWLNPKYTSVTEMKSLNPNTTVTKLRSVTVKTPKPTRWGIGVTAGYGFTPAGHGIFVGGGINYNFIVW